MQTQIWQVAAGKTKMLFTKRSLAIASIRLTHSTLPNVKMRDDGNTVMVEWTDKDGSGVYQDFFAIECIVDGFVYNQVEHL